MPGSRAAGVLSSTSPASPTKTWRTEATWRACVYGRIPSCAGVQRMRPRSAIWIGRSIRSPRIPSAVSKRLTQLHTCRGITWSRRADREIVAALDMPDPVFLGQEVHDEVRPPEHHAAPRPGLAGPCCRN